MWFVNKVEKFTNEDVSKIAETESIQSVKELLKNCCFLLQEHQNQSYTFIHNGLREFLVNSYRQEKGLTNNSSAKNVGVASSMTLGLKNDTTDKVEVSVDNEVKPKFCN